MNIQLRAFGIAKDILGDTHVNLQVEKACSVAEIKQHLVKQFPKFSQLASFSIAVNEEYQNDAYVLKEADEVVILPPVSGG